MTIDDFKKQLKRIGFNPDSTSECNDMMVNLQFMYPLNAQTNDWIPLRVAVLFFSDSFRIDIATYDNKRFRWGTWNTNLQNAPSASDVLAYSISSIVSKYRHAFMVK